MPHTLFTLAAHSDVAKFELEDGVIRVAGSEILRNESTITRLLIDVPTERTTQFSVDTLAADWDAMMVISADSATDSRPENAEALVAESAIISGQWDVTVVELRDIDEEWVGTATPGSKVSFILTRGAGIDPASFDDWLTSAMRDLADRMDNGGSRIVTPIRSAGNAPFDAIASFWFPSEDDLGAAVDGQLFASILASHLVDEGSVRAMSTVEHRRQPNPNAWAMPDGPLMPVREPEPES